MIFENKIQVPESYHGREQAFVKHTLLKNYLERLFMIIGLFQSNIRYVDCFSGPWQEGSEDLRYTSIGISIDIMRRCRNELKNRFNRNVSFHALYIEKNKDSYRKLQDYLNTIPQNEIETESLPGDFFELRSSILQWCGSRDFTFFFIDPKGWKNVIELSTLTPLLQRPNAEFLINFMYDFVLRTHVQEAFNKDMRSIFGELPATDDLHPKEKENLLITLYKNRLKEIAPDEKKLPRAVSVPVLYPLKDRTYYHLVYLTRHAKGITVFMEVSEKLDLVQRKVRAQTKQDSRQAKSGQMELFPAAAAVSAASLVDIADVEQYWLKILSDEPRRFGIEELAQMLEDTGWFEGDFQRAFGNLQRAGRVKNIDDISQRRRTKFVHFQENHNQGECLVKVNL